MARRLRSATAVMSTTALATSAASTNRQLVLRPPSTGTDRKNHTRDRGAPRLRRGATSVGGRGAPRLRRGATSGGGRGAPRLRRGATSVGGYGGPFRGPPFKQTGTRGAPTRRRRGGPSSPRSGSGPSR